MNSKRIKATLPATHPAAFVAANDRCRCNKCATQAEPCAECASYSRIMQEMKPRQ